VSGSFPYSRLAIDQRARSDQDHAARALRERCRGRFVLGLAIDKIVGRLLTSMRTALKSAAKNTQ